MITDGCAWWGSGVCARDVISNFAGGMRSMRAKQKKGSANRLHKSRIIWIQHLENLYLQWMFYHRSLFSPDGGSIFFG